MLNNKQKGFTLPELIIVIGVFAILSIGVFLSLNPAKRLGQANDTQRWEDLTAIAKAVELYQIDNDALPSDLTGINIWSAHKVVLCSSAASLTCDGQTRDCLVLDDTDFLGIYIDALPVDPEKTSDADTGYYVTRTGDMMTFGACSSYDSDGITYVVRASLATYLATCGDGVVEGSEVCDDGYNESCGDSIVQNGSYCNSTCSGYQSLTEACDHGPNTGDDCSLVVGTWTIKTGKVTDTWCKLDCSELLINCVAP